jgi:GST-like protein
MFQMAGVGPMLGQLNHFRNYAPEPIPYAIERYTNEARRLYSVMDTQLAQTPYLAGNAYTIADMAVYPWARSSKKQNLDWSGFPHVQRWFEMIDQRPAVQRGVKVLADLHKPLTSKEAKEALFGAAQYRKEPEKNA